MVNDVLETTSIEVLIETTSVLGPWDAKLVGGCPKRERDDKAEKAQGPRELSHLFDVTTGWPSANMKRT